jgi:hypothetical protein
MTKPPMTDQQLLDYSAQHLMHELSMFWELAAILPHRQAGTETSALIESFVVHLRNLIDFFYREGHGDDVTAQDFLDPTNIWKPNEPVTLTKAHKRANKELSHLTQARISGTPPDKAWDVTGLLDEIDKVAKDFAGKASPTKIHPKVREFLQLPPQNAHVWIGENVTHSNVAAGVTSSVFSAASNSTHTQVISQVELKKD